MCQIKVGKIRLLCYTELRKQKLLYPKLRAEIMYTVNDQTFDSFPEAIQYAKTNAQSTARIKELRQPTETKNYIVEFNDQKQHWELNGKHGDRTYFDESLSIPNSSFSSSTRSRIYVFSGLINPQNPKIRDCDNGLIYRYRNFYDILQENY